MKRFALWIATAITLTAMPALAQVPYTMSYQGVLTDNVGAIPPDGTHNFSFNIYEVFVGGTLLWSESQIGVQVTRGGFSVILGSVTPLSPANGVSFDRQYYLSISIDGGAELSPRVTLASSPYSLGPWTSSGADIYRASGYVGIGTTSPNSLFQLQVETNRVIAIAGRANGTSGTNYAVSGAAEGLGATTNVAGFFRAANATNNYAIVVPFDGGKVGIGTTTPGYLLDVGGSVVGAARISSPGTTAASLHLAFGGSDHVLYSGYPDPGDFSIRSNGATAMIITKDGVNPARVGIGSSRPLANRLEVDGDASKTTAGSWLANSDARIKTNVNTISGALEKLDQVRLVNFHYTEEYRKGHPGLKDRQYCNVIAQEFQRVFAEDVKGSGEKLPNGEEILQVDTYPLTIYSAAAIQALHRLLQANDRELAQLRQELATQKEFAGRMEARFSALENAVARVSGNSAANYAGDGR